MVSPFQFRLITVLLAFVTVFICRGMKPPGTASAERSEPSKLETAHHR